MRKIALVLLVGLSIGFLLYIPRLITIQSVSCTSQFGECSDKTKDLIASVKLGSLAETQEFLTRVLSEYLLISDYSIRFKLPSRLEIYLIERKPVLAIKVGEAGKYGLVDKSGAVLGESSEPSLPRIVISDGEISDQEMLFAIKLASELNKAYSIVDFELIGGLVFNLGDYKVIFPIEGNLDVLLGSLNLIVSRLNRGLEGIRIEEIDLRYKNPILR